MSLINKVPLIFTEGKYSHLSHVNRVSIKDPGLLTLGTPTHFYDLLNYVKKNNIKMAPSYSCIIGGAPVTVSIWNQIQKELRILNPSIGYGCTEASPGITHHPPGLKPLEDGEIGFPLKSIEPRISKGVVIKGPSLCLAIIQDRKIYFPEEFLVSDQIRIRSDGMWIYEGRLDLMVNRGGQKISLEVIEKILFNELGLEVACSSVDDKRLGKDIGILVKAPPEKEIIKKINDKLWEKLGFSISEKKILNVVDFPLNENLKLDRRGVGRFIEGYLDG
jgi:acyl-coenzyme A synthetase/AMP-(fatty) acid ligase